MREVRVGALQLERLERVLPPERSERLRTHVADAAEGLRGRVVWNVNATAQGGGVAEMLRVMVSYGRGAGVDTRWLVLDGDPAFFRVTKRLHNYLHGSPGDGGQLDEQARSHYERVLAENLLRMLETVRPGDLVVLHDPQTAGLVDGLTAAGARVAWRCHIGRDEPDELHDLGWDFLRRYIEGAQAFVFSRRQYAPPWVPDSLLWVIPPSLDPFSAKNVELVDVDTMLERAGLIASPSDANKRVATRVTTAEDLARPRGSLMIDGGPIPGHARVVLQVSRWDRLKDMEGVLRGFADHLARLPEDAHLLLAGPDVLGVNDDPEGAEVLDVCRKLRVALPPSARARVHLTALPMDDVDENARLVNALQRRAAVVVQKSLVEGFGLTVTEPMWKSRPVIASSVGGIRDQIEDGVSGLLLDDPNDLDAYACAVAGLLRDPETAHRLGTGAHERVADKFLGDRHLIQYAELFATMLGADPPVDR
jgi:trehalose synthase